MKKVSVSLLVISASLSLDELSSRFGRAYSSGSHSRSDVRTGGSERWPRTIWRFDSGADQGAPIDKHLESLAVQFPPAELARMLPPESEVLVDDAVFFDTVNMSATYSPHAIQIIQSYNAGLEVTCYPSRFDAKE